MRVDEGYPLATLPTLRVGWGAKVCTCTSWGAVQVLKFRTAGRCKARSMGSHKNNWSAAGGDMVDRRNTSLQIYIVVDKSCQRTRSGWDTDNGGLTWTWWTSKRLTSHSWILPLKTPIVFDSCITDQSRRINSWRVTLVWLPLGSTVAPHQKNRPTSTAPRLHFLSLDRFKNWEH
jgi:hypothetical protein